MDILLQKKLLIKIKSLSEEISGFETKAQGKLFVRDSTHTQIAEAEGWRFALYSNKFPNPSGPCPLTQEQEQRLRKKYAEANESYQKTLISISKKTRQLNKLKNKIDLLVLAELVIQE